MKLKGTRTKTEKVEITTSFQEVFDSLRKTFRKKQGLDPKAYARDGKWYVDVEQHTSHSWTREKEIREATPEELDVLNAFLTLREYFEEK